MATQTMRRRPGRVAAGRRRCLERLAARVTASGERPALEVENAMTGRRLGEVPHCTAEDVAEAARRARAVQAGLGGDAGRASGRRCCCAFTIWCSTARTRCST